MNKLIKERINGIFLLTLAVLIIIGLSLGSNATYSEVSDQIDQGEIITDEGQVQGIEQVIENQNIEQTDVIKEENSILETNEADSLTQETKNDSADPIEEIDNRYDELKRLIKKYCDRSGSDNRKKCKKYCSETDDNKEYKDVYKKYCKADNEDEDETVTTPVVAENELNFIVGSSKFKMVFNIGDTVFDVMKDAKNQGKISFKYEDYGDMGVMITEINDIKNGDDPDWTQNKYWILYVNGKSASVGCSVYKLDRSDTSIEWKYEKYSS